MTRHSPIGWQQWLILASVLVAVAVVSQGVHDIAIEHLGVPYPTLVNPPAWLAAAGDVGRILAMIVVVLVARHFFDRRHLLAACLIVGGLEAMLSERFRLAIIELFLSEGWRNGSWLHVSIDLLPPMTTSLAQGATALLIARLLVPRSKVGAVFAAIVGGAAIQFGLTPLATEMAARLQIASGAIDTTQVFFPPYKGLSLAVIYLTFLEPTLASFLLARLVLPGLPGDRGTRLALFCLIVLGCTGRLTSLALTTFWIHQPPLVAIASTGQFAAETLLMALATGWLGGSINFVR